MQTSTEYQEHKDKNMGDEGHQARDHDLIYRSLSIITVNVFCSHAYMLARV